MRWILAAALIFPPAIDACQKGFKPTDVEGVCVEVDQNEVNPTWVSDEKPPSDKMPSWQREGVTVSTDVASTTASDEKLDMDKANALKEGKRAAGIK